MDLSIYDLKFNSIENLSGFETCITFNVNLLQGTAKT